MSSLNVVRVPTCKSAKQKTQFEEPSVFINFCHNSILSERIHSEIEKLNWGVIDRIDEIPLKKISGKKPGKKLYIHFSGWNTDCSEAESARKKLLSGETIQIIYDSPWYWNAKMSNSKKIYSTKKSKIKNGKKIQQKKTFVLGSTTGWKTRNGRSTSTANDIDNKLENLRRGYASFVPGGVLIPES